MAKAVVGLIERGEANINGRPGFAAFGLHSAEPGHPPEPFQEAFDIARKGGLVAVPHAGEIAPSKDYTGAKSVRYCVQCFGAKRIEHGVLAAQESTSVIGGPSWVAESLVGTWHPVPSTQESVNRDQYSVIRRWKA